MIQVDGGPQRVQGRRKTALTSRSVFYWTRTLPRCAVRSRTRYSALSRLFETIEEPREELLYVGDPKMAKTSNEKKHHPGHKIQP
jgi:hypothetical protein